MKWFAKHDLDGFFGLFIDNLVQLLLIVSLCGALCGMTGEHARFIYQHILPGAAVSILIGNIFYAWQAHRLARRTNRDDVTALPYGINTPSLLVYVFFVMAPVYRSTGSPEIAWKMGLFACVGSGLIELAGALIAERVRRHTPRAALLSTLAGIAIGFIAMKFALEIFAAPLVAMLPLAFILLTYFAKAKMPLGLPGGLVAVLCGTLIAWCLPEAWLAKPMNLQNVADAWTQRGAYFPQWAGNALRDVFTLPTEQWLGFISVIIPMGLFNVIGSLQNIESAEAAGDTYDTGASLAMNGLGTFVAALFGSCFPTTIYIGHPGWKSLGARAGYSTLNGLVITILCFTGTIAFVHSLIPLEAGIAIVLWIGLVITAQAFQATPDSHAPAVAIGLFPAIAAWGATVMLGTFNAADPHTAHDNINTIQSILLSAGPTAEVSGFLIHGLNLMERGYIFTCMVLSAISARLIDRRFNAAAIWSLIGAALAALGLTHAYQVTGNSIDYLLIWTTPDGSAFAYRAWPIVAGYILIAATCFGFGTLRPNGDSKIDSLS